MFPLEQVVLPGFVVPLHIFEPRYHDLARDLGEQTDPRMGFTLIVRGREVGGEDQRSDVGVVAQIADCEELDDGCWSIVAAATHRIRVNSWLEDDPYPKALVADWPDEAGSGSADSISHLITAFEMLAHTIHRVDPSHDLRATSFSDDPSEIIWEVIAKAQLGTFDNHTLLRCADLPERAGVATHMIHERRELLEALAEHNQ